MAPSPWLDGHEKPRRGVSATRTLLARRVSQSGTVKVDNYQVIAGGYSRHMARFTAHCDGQSSNLIMRADPVDANVTIESDRTREWELLHVLTERTHVPMPRALYFDEDGSELGSKTIILEAVQGHSLLAEIRGEASPLVADPVDAFAKLAARIHQTDLAQLPEEIEAARELGRLHRRAH